MAQYRTRRQGRYSKLRDSGFTAREAQVLSNMPLNVPYMRKLVTERRQELRKAVKSGLTVKKFQDNIKNFYVANKFLKDAKISKKTGKVIRARIDPWAMLRDYEDKFKAKTPQYDSPWQKKQKGFRDYMSKVERTIAKQSGLQMPTKSISEPRQGTFID